MRFVSEEREVERLHTAARRAREILVTAEDRLEALHGFKLGYYLDTRNTTRRLMWTLAHAHGTLFSLVQIAFAVTLPLCAEAAEGALRWCSRLLLGALVLLPLGFFWGGLTPHGGDPGLGIFLVPVGALMMVAGTAGFLRLCLRGRTTTPPLSSPSNPDTAALPRKRK